MFASCRAVRAVVALGLLAAALAACSGDSEASLPTPSKAFCQAAYDYDTNAIRDQFRVAADGAPLP